MSGPARYAVIGDPVSHSLSPTMHNGWIADHELNATYEALLLRSDDPVAAIRALGSQLAGANVTVPHKEAAAKAAGWADGTAANTLRWGQDGTLSAFNTDGAGFIAALDEAQPIWRRTTRRALVVGAGGAAIGLGQALSPIVGAVQFINRTLAKAQAAADLIPNGEAAAWESLDEGFASNDLIVQATTLGMAGQPEMSWPVERCQKHAIIADIVYRPLETPLLREARAAGLATMGGLGMLIHQGALAFELWFGIKPDTVKARARLLAALT